MTPYVNGWTEKNKTIERVGLEHAFSGFQRVLEDAFNLYARLQQFDLVFVQYMGC